MCLVACVGAGLAPAQSGQNYQGYDYIIELGEVYIQAYTGAEEELIIPSTIEGIPVTFIRTEAFAGCTSLVSVTIPEGVQTLGQEVFLNCANLRQVTVPGSVLHIGYEPFTGCVNLSSISVSPESADYTSQDGALFTRDMHDLIRCPARKAGQYTIPETVVRVMTAAFADCSLLRQVSFSEGVEEIGERAFLDCTGLQSVLLPGSLEKIGAYAFARCTSLPDIWIPDRVNTIHYWAFSGCASLGSIRLPDRLSTIRSHMFEGCMNLRKIIFPSRVNKIENHAFASCSALKTMVIPGNLTTIEYRVFQDCVNLTTVIIPDSVTEINSEAFSGCTSLRAVLFKGDAPDLGWRIAFEDSPATILYFRPGTTGWAPEVAGRSTALWIPLTLAELQLTADEPLRLHSSSPAPPTLRVQRGTNLRDWEDWQTVSRDEGPSEMSDPDTGTVGYRFYRVVED